MFLKPDSSGVDFERNSSQIVVPSLPNSHSLLPVFKQKSKLLYLLEKLRVLIIVGETGSGKTTQIPQYLLDAGWSNNGKLIACTQPRRLAAVKVSTRVAEERRCALGDQVGFLVRFDSNYSKNTRILYLSDEMLFRETLNDPLLMKYSVIMIDESHERNLFTDLNLGLLKKILSKRSDLRVIISSATMDSKLFQEYFNNGEERIAEVLTVQGKPHPVHVQYLLEPCENYLETALDTVINIHKFEAPGDILLFVSDRETINSIVITLNERNDPYLYSVPLHADLSIQDQISAIEKPAPGVRKVVVATNVAETSVTIEGIVYVIDTGVVELNVFDPNSGLESIISTTISRASAKQRAGRAGRIKPGKVFRLYTEESFLAMPKHIVPEIQRGNMASAILQMKALGIGNVVRFDYISPPPPKLISHALELLYSLNALDDYGRLTIPFGVNIAESPIDPQISSMLLSSDQFQCSEEALTLAAMLVVKSPFISPARFKREAETEKIKYCVEEGDHITLINVYNSFISSKQSIKYCTQNFLDPKALARAYVVRGHLKRWVVKCGVELVSCKGDIERIRKCIVAGFFSQVAQLTPDGTYRSVRDKEVVLYIDPSSVLYHRAPEWIVFHELLETSRPYMRECTVIEGKWLLELASHYYQQRSNETRFNFLAA